MLKTLVEFEAWSVCETDEYEDNAGNVITQVYGEHYRDCRKNPAKDVNPQNPTWSWEYDDEPDHGVFVCWECGGTVPEEVVAIVQLHNWGKKHRGLE